jgi:hypothetical protein
MRPLSRILTTLLLRFPSCCIHLARQDLYGRDAGAVVRFLLGTVRMKETAALAHLGIGTAGRGDESRCIRLAEGCVEDGRFGDCCELAGLRFQTDSGRDRLSG